MTSMTVNQLVDLLAQHIAAGHGDDDVLVTLHSGDISAGMQNILDRHDWAVSKAETLGAHGGSWIHLEARPTR